MKLPGFCKCNTEATQMVGLQKAVHKNSSYIKHENNPSGKL